MKSSTLPSYLQNQYNRNMPHIIDERGQRSVVPIHPSGSEYPESTPSDSESYDRKKKKKKKDKKSPSKSVKMHDEVDQNAGKFSSVKNRLRRASTILTS